MPIKQKGKKTTCLLIIILTLMPTLILAEDVWDYRKPNVKYLHRTTNEPWDIHVLIVDLKNPGTSIRNVIGQDKTWGREVVSSMASRHTAFAAVNSDFCGYERGIPEGLCVINNEIIIAPKYRTALGFSQSNSGRIGIWTDRWNWHAKVTDEQKNEHDIVMMNLDINADWLCLYTDKYGHTTPGTSVSNNVVEVLVGPDSTVNSIRDNQTGINISQDHYVLTGREAAADWLRDHISTGEKLRLNLTTVPDWKNLWQAASGGPRIVKDGACYADPVATFPNGEDFTLDFKQGYYNTRNPRCAAGLTVNGDTLILAVVDGRQPSHSVGMTLAELANLMIEFGAWDALQFDSGGSATFYYQNQVRNQPSDGTERAVAGALCLYSDKNYLNIAPQSAVLEYSGEYAPDFSVDKLTDNKRYRGSGKWAGEATDSVHWVELDLGRPYHLTHLQLFHGFYVGDPDYLNTKEFKIYTRDDSLASWIADFHINNQFQSRDNLCTYDSPKSVRYVRLEVLQANHVADDNILRQPEFAIYIEDTAQTNLAPEISYPAAHYELNQNYPNPFNATTTIVYKIPMTGKVQLTIYDLNGCIVEKLVADYQTAGRYVVRWEASQQSSGVYFVHLVTKDFTAVKKMILMK